MTLLYLSLALVVLYEVGLTSVGPAWVQFLGAIALSALGGLALGVHPRVLPVVAVASLGACRLEIAVLRRLTAVAVRR